ncbi:hypothetical protein THAOC_06911, partial [Thalassiosira oceanica]
MLQSVDSRGVLAGMVPNGLVSLLLEQRAAMDKRRSDDWTDRACDNIREAQYRRQLKSRLPMVPMVATDRKTSYLSRRRLRASAACVVTVAALRHLLVHSPELVIGYRDPFSGVVTTSTSRYLRRDDKVAAWDWGAPPSLSRRPLKEGIRIAFRLRDYTKSEYRAQAEKECHRDRDKERDNRARDLPPTLVDVRSEYEWAGSVAPDPVNRDKFGRGGRYLDFSTSVSTDLKVLFLGDSVAEQFGHAFDDAATTEAHLNPNATSSTRIVLNSFRVGGQMRNCVFASAPVRGGGAVALWRVVKLFSMRRKGGGTCNNNAGGWNDHQLSSMLEQEFQPANANSFTIGQFDAVVLRIQLGWMPPRAITKDTLNETISLCRDHIGARTVVVMTINFTNDVHNPAEWAWAASMNELLREMARTFNKNATEHQSEFRVQIMEFANFTTQVHWANARTIRAPDGDSFEYPNLMPPKASEHNWDQNATFLFDRFKPGKKSSRKEELRQIEECERLCNDQFMSLVPINESWLEKEATLYSVGKTSDECKGLKSYGVITLAMYILILACPLNPWFFTRPERLCRSAALCWPRHATALLGNNPYCSDVARAWRGQVFLPWWCRKRIVRRTFASLETADRCSLASGPTTPAEVVGAVVGRDERGKKGTLPPQVRVRGDHYSSSVPPGLERDAARRTAPGRRGPLPRSGAFSVAAFASAGSTLNARNAPNGPNVAPTETIPTIPLQGCRARAPDDTAWNPNASSGLMASARAEEPIAIGSPERRDGYILETRAAADDLTFKVQATTAPKGRRMPSNAGDDEQADGAAEVRLTETDVQEILNPRRGARPPAPRGRQHRRGGG